MISWIDRWIKRRRIIKRLIAFAKTKEGRKFIEELNENNLILADYDASILGAESPYDEGTKLRINIPNEDWRKFNV